MVEGFVYAADTEPGRRAGAGTGDRVGTPFPGPPWIVVDHTIETVIQHDGRIRLHAHVHVRDRQRTQACWLSRIRICSRMISTSRAGSSPVDAGGRG